jgi:vitamin B12 transporter
VGSTVYVVTKKDMDRQSLPAATDYLAQTPGINVASQGGNGHITTFFMRGLPGEYVKTFIDGIDVSDVTYTKTQAQFGQFLAGDLDRIEVLQGSQGALYGADAIAGVVNISTLGVPEKGIHQRIYGEGGSRGTFLGGYSLNSGFDRGNFGFNIVGLTTDGFSTAASGTEKDGYENLSGTIGGRFDINENLSIFANGLFIKSNTDFDDSFPPPTSCLGTAMRIPAIAKLPGEWAWTSSCSTDACRTRSPCNIRISTERVSRVRPAFLPALLRSMAPEQKSTIWVPLRSHQH